MKKVIVAIIAVLYMGLSSGIAMDIHYCMGKKAGADFYSSENEKCGKCGMKNKASGCCNDEHKFYKLSDSHKTASNDLKVEAPVAIITTAFTTAGYQQLHSSIVKSSLSNAPPQYQRPPASVLYCIFRL